jgi:AraC family transcriptional regulator
MPVGFHENVGFCRKIDRVRGGFSQYDERAIAEMKHARERVYVSDQPDHVLATQRMHAYIEAHLSQPITLQALARAAGYSPWHCARVFKEVTGKTPYDYIRAVRLSKAALRLAQTQDKIIDVALDFVFDTPDGFSRAFTSTFGLTPSQYRERLPAIKLFLPCQVKARHRTDAKGEKSMSDQMKPVTVFVQVIERPARRLIIRRGVRAADYYEYCSEVGCDIWETLSSIKDALYEPIGLWLPPHMVPPGTSAYAQGVEMPAGYSGPVPDLCELVDLPPCKMMVFQGPPYEDEKYEDAISDIWEVMKDYKPEIYGFRWADDDGPRFQLAPMGYRGYIEARPVRPVNS